MANSMSTSEQQLNIARHLRNRRDFVQACACYLSLMESSSSLQHDEQLADEIGDCLREVCHQMTSVDAISMLYTRALQVMPESAFIHSCMGDAFFKLKELEKARGCYIKLLDLEPDNPSATENVDNISCQLVDRWHFFMLNDKRRNKAFELAIQRAKTSERASILDIGSGTCLLSMMAVQAGFTAVYACDDNKAMYDVSQNILLSNDLAEKVTLYPAHSTELALGSKNREGDKLARLNAVVTETVDCGLFGEHILSTVSHAWRNLLLQEVSRVVIPGGAELFCCVIEAPDIALHHRCAQPDLKGVNLNDVQFVDWTSQPVADLPLADMFDPYTTYNMKTLRKGYKILTEKKKCMEVNLNSLQCVEHLLAGHQQMLNVTALQDGCMHAIALWFDLHLDDEVTISTDPEGEPSCWGPAIFPLSNLSDSNAQVAAGDTLTVRAVTYNDCLQLTLSNVSRRCDVTDEPTNPRAKETIAQPVEGVVDCSRTSAEYHCDCRYSPPPSSFPSTVLSTSKVYLDTQEIYRLNDRLYNNKMICAAMKLKDCCTNASFSVLDTSAMFTTLPLQASGLGADLVYWLGADNYRKSLYTILCHANNIKNALNVPDVETLGDVGIDCVLCDLVEPNGVMRQRVLNDLAYLKLTSLKIGRGVIVPDKVVIWGQCIHAPHLLDSNQVVDDFRTCGYHIASHFNQFKARTERDIDMTTLNYCACSPPIQLLTLHLNSLEVGQQGLPTFLNQENTHDIELTCGESHDVTAVVYWFELVLDDSLTISTCAADSHWRQAATVVSRPDGINAKVNSVIAKVKDGVLGIGIS